MTVSGILLAGGRGTRLGEDKRAVRILGTSLLDRAAALLESVADDVVIVSRDGGGGLGRARIIRDEIPDLGPVAGLLTGLRAIRHGHALVLPVDMPLLAPQFLAHLVLVSTGWDITVPQWIRLEPLVGVYSAACLRPLEQYIRVRRASVADFVRSADLTVRYVPEEEIRRFGDPARLFLNVNDRVDLLRAAALLRDGAAGESTVNLREGR